MRTDRTAEPQPRSPPVHSPGVLRTARAVSPHAQRQRRRLQLPVSGLGRGHTASASLTPSLPRGSLEAERLQFVFIWQEKASSVSGRWGAHILDA